MPQPFRMPTGVDDFLLNGTTPDEQVVAEAQSCVGDPESYERTLVRQAERPGRPRVMCTADGRPLMSLLTVALGAEDTD